MPKKQEYQVNYDAIPKQVDAGDVGSILKAYMMALNVTISQDGYDNLPDWAKKYWKVS